MQIQKRGTKHTKQRKIISLQEPTLNLQVSTVSTLLEALALILLWATRFLLSKADGGKKI